MPRTGTSVASIAVVAASACTWSAPGGPVLLGVAPADAPNHVEVTLSIAGRDLEPAVEVDFDDPGASTVDSGFTAALVAGARRIALTSVERVSAAELRATLPPGGEAGTYALEVRDPRGRVFSLPGAFLLWREVAVTTSVDEKDAGATPDAPLGTGLSLREAVDWVNAQSGAQVITLAAPMTIAMTGPQTYMTLTAPGAAIVAEPGVRLDFGGINQSCLTLAGPGQRLVGVTLSGCSGTFVTMAPSSAGSQVAHVTVDVSGTPYWAYGILAQASSATPSRIGPGNDLSRLWIALKVDGGNYEILGNRVHDNSVGARLAGGKALLWQNDFFGHVSGSSNKGLGVELLVGPGPVEILQNGFHRNAVSGIEAAAVGSLTVRGNLFTANGAFGLDASAGGLTHDHNGYFGNGAPVAPGLANDLSDLLVDPLLVDPAGSDFRLQPGSPAIDAGIDVGLDLNGAADGSFNGTAPDLGAWESP